jgi:hypothetical protein
MDYIRDPCRSEVWTFERASSYSIIWKVRQLAGLWQGGDWTRGLKDNFC